jgi:hypothetical protein
VRPVSDRPLRITSHGVRVYGASSDAGDVVARAVARRTAQLTARDDRSAPRPAPAPAPAPPTDPAQALLAARPAAPGVDTEVSIRVFADGGSIAVVRHLRAGEVVGIEAMIR